MLIRCAWCKRITGDKPPYGGKYDKEITDGICKGCETRYFPKRSKEKEQPNPKGGKCHAH